MGFYRYFAVGILAALSGIFGNLVAAIVQSSLGRITLFQVAVMVLGIVAVIGINYRLEQRSTARERDVEALCSSLAEHRLELYRIEAKHSRGQRLTVEEVESWRRHQAAVASIKQRLRSMNVECVYDTIDDLPPPALGCLTKGMAIAKQVSMLFVFPFVFALAVAYPLSPAAHVSYLAALPYSISTPTPAAVAIVTPQTPTPIPSAIITSGGTMVASIPTIDSRTVTPTPVSGTTTPLRPTATPIDTSAMTPTPEATQTRPASQGPSSPTPRETLLPPTRTQAPTSVPLPSATLLATPSPTGQPAPLELVAPDNGASMPGAVVLQWRDTFAGLTVDPYLVVIEHSAGTNYAVTSATTWQIPTWLQDFQPEDGYRWWVAVCAGAVPGDYSSQPCTATSRTSEVRRFQWRP